MKNSQPNIIEKLRPKEHINLSPFLFTYYTPFLVPYGPRQLPSLHLSYPNQSHPSPHAHPLLERRSFQPHLNASDVLPSEIEIRIFPNPASESLIIQLTGEYPRPFKIGVFDILGRSVFPVEETLGGGGPQSYKLDVSRLAPGMYVVRVEGASRAFNRLVSVIK